MISYMKLYVILTVKSELPAKPGSGFGGSSDAAAAGDDASEVMSYMTSPNYI